MNIGLKRLFAVALLASVLPAVSATSASPTPRPPTSMCAKHDLLKDVCVTMPKPDARPVGRALKWHPGHYMQIPRGKWYLQQRNRFRLYDQISGERDLEGVVVPMPWSQLEPSRGNYAAGIELVRAELDKLASLRVPKRMFIRMMDSGYMETCPATTMMPGYVTQLGGSIQTDKGCMWRRWDETTMGYYIDMLKAYGAALDDQPYFEGIVVLREIPLAWGRTAPPADYGNRRYREQLDRLMAETVAAFPTSIVVSPTSWVGSKAETVNHIRYVHSIGGAVGNMDVCPDCRMWADQTVRGELGGTDFRGKMPLVYSVETSELGLDSIGPDGGYTPYEIYRWANHTQRVTHLFWDRNDYAGTPQQQWPAILSFIRSNPLTYTQCPKNVGTCDGT